MIFLSLKYYDEDAVEQTVWLSEQYMSLPSALGSALVEPRLSKLSDFKRSVDILSDSVIKKSNYSIKCHDNDAYLYNLLKNTFYTNSTVKFYELNDDLSYSTIATGVLKDVNFESDLTLKINDVNSFQVSMSDRFPDGAPGSATSFFLSASKAKYDGTQKPACIGRLDGIEGVQVETLDQDEWNEFRPYNFVDVAASKIEDKVITYISNPDDDEPEEKTDHYFVFTFSTAAKANHVKRHLSVGDKIMYQLTVGGKVRDMECTVVNLMESGAGFEMLEEEIWTTPSTIARAVPTGAQLYYKSDSNSISENSFYITKDYGTSYITYTINNYEDSHVHLNEDVKALEIGDILRFECTKSADTFYINQKITEIDTDTNKITFDKELGSDVLDTYNTGNVLFDKIRKVKIEDDKIFQNTKDRINIELDSKASFIRNRNELQIGMQGLLIKASHALTTNNDLSVQFIYQDAALNHTFTTEALNIKTLKIYGAFNPENTGITPVSQTDINNYINAISETGLTISSTIETVLEVVTSYSFQIVSPPGPPYTTYTKYPYVSADSGYDLAGITVTGLLFRAINKDDEIKQFFFYFNLIDGSETYYVPTFLVNTTLVNIDYVSGDTIADIQAAFETAVSASFDTDTRPYVFTKTTAGEYFIDLIYNTFPTGNKFISAIFPLDQTTSNNEVYSEDGVQCYDFFDSSGMLRIQINKTNVTYINNDRKRGDARTIGAQAFTLPDSFYAQTTGDLSKFSFRVANSIEGVSEGDVFFVTYALQSITNTIIETIPDTALIGEFSEEYSTDQNFKGLTDVPFTFYLFKQSIFQDSSTQYAKNLLCFRGLDFSDPKFYYQDEHSNLEALIEKIFTIYNDRSLTVNPLSIITNNMYNLEKCGIRLDKDEPLYKSLVKAKKLFNVIFFTDVNGVINCNNILPYSDESTSRIIPEEIVNEAKIKISNTNYNEVLFTNRPDYSEDQEFETRVQPNIASDFVSKLDDVTKQLSLTNSDSAFMTQVLSNDETFAAEFAKKYLSKVTTVEVVVDAKDFDKELLDVVHFLGFDRIEERLDFYLTKISRSSGFVKMTLTNLELPIFIINFIVDESANPVVSEEDDNVIG